MKFRADIQKVRGISFLGILFFHLDKNIFANGYLGVDVFFVISGFLVTPMVFNLFINIESHRDLVDQIRFFVISRILRLGPAFLVASTTFSLLVILFGDASLFRNVLIINLSTIYFFGNYSAYKYSGDYFHPDLTNPFVHYWSLSVEEQLYIFLPLILVIAYALGKKYFCRISLLILFLLTFLSAIIFLSESIAKELYSIVSDQPLSFAFFSPISRFWEFGIGGICSRLIPRTLKNRNQIKFLLLFILVLIVFFPLDFSSRILTLLVVLITTFYLSFLDSESNSDFFGQALVWLGNRSYSLYLVHMPVIYLVTRNPFAGSAQPIQRFVLSILAMVLSIQVGNILFKHVEQKFRLSRDRNQLRSKEYDFRRTISAVVVYGFFLSSSFGIVLFSGYPTNFSQHFRNNPAANFVQDCRPVSKLKQFPCEFPHLPGQKIIVIIGDSHASQYSQLINTIASGRNTRVVMVGDFVTDFQFKSVTESLVRYSPDAIVISKLWDSTIFSSAKLSLKLQKFTSYSGKLIILGQNPIFTRSAPESGISTLNTLLGQSVSMDQESKRYAFNLIASHDDKLVRTWASRSSTVFVDPKKFLCGLDRCPRFLNQTALYVDGNHLSSAGASLLISEFRRLL